MPRLRTNCRPDDLHITVPRGGNLQAAVNGAPHGATIRVYPDTYDGLVLPARDARLTIQPDTAALDALARVHPDMGDALIKLRPNAGGTGSAVVATGAAQGYQLIGVQCLPGDPGTTMIAIGTPGATDAAQLPRDLTFDRCLLVADPARGGRRGIAANGGEFACVRSYFDEFWDTADSQGICGWTGPGPFLVEDCFIAATGQCVMFGGADSSHERVMPADATIRGNTLTKRLHWQGAPGRVVKNGFELKAMRRALVENNVIEYAWISGQNGTVNLFTPRNQDGGAPWTEVVDVTFRWNLVRHGGAAINILGTDNVHPSGPTACLSITDNLFLDIGTAAWGNGRFWQLQGGYAIAFQRNTGAIGPMNSFLTFDGPPVEGLIVTDNILPEAAYGLIGSGHAPGVGSWAAYVRDGRFDRNVIQRTGSAAYTYPGTNTITDPGASALGPDYRPLPAFAHAGCDIDELLRRIPTDALIEGVSHA
jgi:hypothetical protein